VNSYAGIIHEDFEDLLEKVVLMTENYEDEREKFARRADRSWFIYFMWSLIAATVFLTMLFWVRSQFADVKSELKGRQAALDSLKTQYDSLHVVYDSLRVRSQNYEGRMTELDSTMRFSKGEIARLNEFKPQLTMINVSIDTILARTNVQEARISSLDEQVGSIGQRVDECNTLLNELQGQYAAIQNTESTFRASTSAIRQSLQVVENSHGQLKKTNDSLAGQLKSTQKRADTLGRKLDIVMAALKRQEINIERDDIDKDFRDLYPYVRKWGIVDSVARRMLVSNATETEQTEFKQALSQQVYDKIQKWLDSNDAKESAAFPFIEGMLISFKEMFPDSLGNQ